MRKKLDGCYEEYSSVDEFKQHLTPDNSLSISKENYGWVFWTPAETDIFKEKITHVLRKLTSKWEFLCPNILVQFWAPEEVGGGRCRLTTLHQPFAVDKSLAKGLSWLRKKCMQQYFYLADDQHQLGPPARVFRNGNPESSPDILHYTTQEFPLRDLVTGCGLNSYLVLPIFDVSQNRCVGVLEFMSTRPESVLRWFGLLEDDFDDALQEVELTLAHKIRDYAFEDYDCIMEMLDLSIENVPQLHLAMAWVPCKKSCGNFNCMELARSKRRKDHDDTLSKFLEACRLHHIQYGQGIVGLALSSTNKWCFCENISDFSISEYPMKHYAQQAGLSSCIAICARSKHDENDSYVFEFFIQPQSRDGASIKSILYLLLKIMETKLKIFEISAEQYLGVVECQQLKEQVMANVIPMKEYKGRFLESEFKEFFQTVELSCLPMEGKHVDDWVCWSMKEKELFENRGNATSIIPQLNQGIEEIKHLLSEMLSIGTFRSHFLIQFWAPKMIGKRSFLSTSEQPFALGHLQKGLCWYRKQCIQHLYYIGDGAKEDELGPPGRVFLNGHPESSPDLRLYSEREFPLRDHVVKTGARKYFALPLFNLLHEKCVGVLEFVGCSFYLEEINEKLEKSNLRSTPISCPLSTSPIHEGQSQALFEIDEMLTLVIDIPQVVQTAAAWISCSCRRALNNIEISCVKRAWLPRTDTFRIFEFMIAYKFHQVHTRKGTIRKVIESQSKLYFCENLCSSSICEQPLAHHAQETRLETCFAVCLKSSYTGNSLYVIEFFLSPHSTKYEYSRTLCFLLSTMKQMLKSFKLASGQQLISDGIDSRTCVEYVTQNVTGFSTANQLIGENIGDISSPPIQKTMEFASTSQLQAAADVIIKAKFKDETLKFEFCVSWGLEKLMEEVGKRLNLNIGDQFKLKYVDEDDGDLISLTCDEDLRFFVKSMKSIGKTTVQVFLHLISE
ncbi:uncharacterized protein [Henckelia pumila]|uniref:uncharacterized protein isoform X2 n=1 Tax=Henckelia pumila TaxID=405737 RepID=UPI003C6E2AB7